MKPPSTQSALTAFAFRRPSARRESFTLVELVVSMAILSIIVLTLATMMGFVVQTWLAGINAANNFTKARTMLTLLDRDTQLMVLRPDLPAFADASNTPPGAACAFYTKVQGQPGADTRAVSLVQYSLEQEGSPATNSILQRFNCGMNYTPGGITPTVGTGSYISNMVQMTNSVVETAAPSPENVVNGVIAFKWQFIDGNGNILDPPYNYYYTPAGFANPVVTITPTPFFYDFTNPGAAYNPRMLIVSLVVVSDNAYKMAVQTSTLQTLINQFSTNMPTGLTTTVNGANYDTETYAQYWNSILNPPPPGTFPSGAAAKLPAPEIAAGAIQVFERHIPLPLITPSAP